MSTRETDSRNKLNRRQFIKRLAVGILGVSAVLTTWRMLIDPRDEELGDPYPEIPQRKPILPPYNRDALFFDEHQYALVAALAALIIPTDDDPGATEAGVVDYIDSLVANSKYRQTEYTKGLKWLDDLSREMYGADEGFLSLSLKQNIHLLRLIEQAHVKRTRPASTFLQRVGRKIDKVWDGLFGMGKNSRFFSLVRKDVITGYFSNPISWKVVGYYGPPQPNGYPDFSRQPSSAHYTGSVRFVSDRSCLICHEEGKKHQRGGLINHACKVCHRPHSPWTYNKDAFHLEDHIGFAFSNPDRKKRGK